MKIIKLLLATVCLLAVQALSAQQGKLFNADRQLSSSFVNQVYRDRDGFIWVATRNGLNKYDGYQFHTFRREGNRQSGMASNYVICMLQDRRGLFYLGMYGALQTFDGQHFSDVQVFDLHGRPAPSYITCLLQRRDGTLLAGTSGHGLLRIDHSGTARQLGGPLSGIHTVRDLLEDSQGMLWIVTANQGLYRYDGRRVSRYLITADGRPTMVINRLQRDNDGNIYAGTASDGLLVLRRGSDHFEPVDGLPHQSIMSLYLNRQGQLMVGFDGGGLAVYHPQTGHVELQPYFSTEVDLTRGKVASVTEDQNGNVWLALLQKGVYMQPGTPSGFHYMGYRLGQPNNVIGAACVTSTLIDRQGRTWVGTDKDGLYCLDQQHQLLAHLKEQVPSSVLGLAEDLHGRIWLSAYLEGCGYVDPQQMVYHHQSLPQGSTVSVFSIAADRQGYVWLGTMGNGLLRLDPDNGQVMTYAMHAAADADRQANGLINNYISHVSPSADGKRIYLATTMGAACLEMATGNWINTFKGNTPNYGQATRIVREYGGHLWIGTNDGLYRYDLKRHQMEPVGRKDGLADNGIASIEADRHGRIWAGTEHGLYCIDPKTSQTAVYFVDNGLQSNEFSDGASCTGTDGQMLFGGVGGINWFDPLSIRQSEWQSETRLTSFTINGQEVTPATRSGIYTVTDTTVIATRHFHLCYDDNSFTLRFSTLTYDNPEHITYIYSINGEPWTELQPGVNELNFSHLAPGTYHFRVKARRNHLTTAERTFSVTVHAPWYRSTAAYIGYILLVAAALWMLLRYRQRREQEQLRLQAHIHAEELGEAKLRFFMNISHEIRTPMTLIVSPLLTLLKEDNDPHRREVYKTIRRNAERILHLINQMMDLRKIDKGQMNIQMSCTDLIGFVSDVYTLFEHQAKAKRITLNYEHDCDELPVWIDRSQFDKVVVNLLSNAFKYTPPEGSITIRITHDDQQAHLAIADTGEGIPPEQLERIFERFYQSPTSASNRHTGTGIGLDLTRSLVELHHGTISARNLQPHGSEFVVSIPLGNAHLKPDEMCDETTEEATPLPLTGTTPQSEQSVESERLETNEKPLSGNKRSLIIVAEDDDEIRSYLATELGQDYEVRTFSNGRDALALALKEKPDLVLSDVMMPQMSGHELCAKLKGNPQTNHVPVVLLTAKNRDEDRLQGLETGADAYIVKPFNMDILRQTISNLLRSHHLLKMKYGRTDGLEEQIDDVELRSPDDKLLQRVMQVINANLNNSDVSVDEIAEQVGVSRVHLHRKMKELTGQTPHDFMRSIRLKQAATLLSRRGMSITEVMYACGFSNPASFSTIFRRFYGMSPREYMNEQLSRSREERS